MPTSAASPDSADPLVVLRVLQVGRIRHRLVAFVACRTASARRAPSRRGRGCRCRSRCPAATARPARTPCRSPSSGTASACRSSRRRPAAPPLHHLDSRGGRCRDRSSRSRPAAASRPRPSARSRRSRPMKRSFFQPTIQPEAGLEHGRRLVDVVAVQAHRRLEAQRVARAEAARARRRPSGRTRAAPARRGRPCSAARRSRSRPRRCSRCARSSRGRWRLPRARTRTAAISPSSTPVSGCSTSREAGPWMRDQRVAAARVDRRRVAGRLDLLADPGVVLRDVRGVDDEQEVARRHAVDEHVVDERAVRRQQARILRLADLQLRWRRCTRSAARRPARSCRRSRSRPCG